MGQYTIKDIQSQAEIIKEATDNIYRAIYTKSGYIANSLNEIAAAIMDIQKPPVEEPLTITPTIDGQEISALEDLKYNPITVEPVTSAIDSNIQPENIKEGVTILGVVGTLSGGSGVFVVPDGTKFTDSTFTEIPSNLDTSNVTDMSKMFYNCRKLTSIPQLNTSNVTDMHWMFHSCSLLTTIPQLDTANVTNMSSIFYNCSSLTTVEGIDFSGLTSSPSLSGPSSSNPNITRFIVNGKINVSISDDYSIKSFNAIDYDSIKSILAAADRTDNTNAKELAFNRTMTDQNGELAALVASCTSKGWTITGLTLN